MASAERHPIPQGYILRNRITHIRTLPAPSSHAFKYTTITFLLGLDTLESGRLDLASGWLFGYGGRWGRLLGLRTQPYLNTLSTSSIRKKLEDEFQRHSILQTDTFEDAWMMTMPSICGFEGINPLTVYFCYKERKLWTVVLEIHNTFGESHIHLLEIGKNEDSAPAQGYDHQWTFRRQFHVSPFNDRSGHYTVSIKSPGGSPRSYMTDANADILLPQPAVCVRLYTDSDLDSVQSVSTSSSNGARSTYERSSPGQLKLGAYLRATSALPFTTWNVIGELAKQPFVLLLTFPRILYHAWILHYRKRLDVLPRPEPYRPAMYQSKGHNEPSIVSGGGVGWQGESSLETYTRKLVASFLVRRVEETRISVLLVPANTNIAPTKFTSTTRGKENSNIPEQILEISYLSPRFFTILFMCPSSEHVLLVGCDAEDLFHPSSRELFNTVFTSTFQHHHEPQESEPSALQNILQNIRRGHVPRSLKLASPPTHFLDAGRSIPRLMASTAVLWALMLMECLERVVFRLSRARFVEGREPWNAWQRAMKNKYASQGEGGTGKAETSLARYGSVRRGE